MPLCELPGGFAKMDGQDNDTRLMRRGVQRQQLQEQPRIRGLARNLKRVVPALVVVLLAACGAKMDEEASAPETVDSEKPTVAGDPISYEWEDFDEFGDTTFSPWYEGPYLLEKDDATTLEVLKAKIPGAEIVYFNGLPLLKNVPTHTVSNLDVPISFDLKSPTLAEVLLEINRQINCALRYGEFNRLSVHSPTTPNVWFPPPFLHEPLGATFQLSGVPAREALFESFRRSSLTPRFRYANAYSPFKYGEDASHKSYLSIDFFEGDVELSLNRGGIRATTYKPSWAKDDEILSDEECREWFRALTRSNEPKKHGLCEAQE